MCRVVHSECTSERICCIKEGNRNLITFYRGRRLQHASSIVVMAALPIIPTVCSRNTLHLHTINYRYIHSTLCDPPRLRHSINIPRRLLLISPNPTLRYFYCILCQFYYYCSSQRTPSTLPSHSVHSLNRKG